MPHNFGPAMPFLPDTAMNEGLHLVQAGRLAEATALIQRTLGSRIPGGLPAAPAAIPPAPAAPAMGSAHQSPSLSQRLQDIVGQLPALREHLPRVPTGDLLLGRGAPLAPALALPGTVQTGEHHCPAGSRPYRLYVPSTSPDRPRPLVVMLHGGTQDAVAFAAATGMDAVAEEHGILVVYPEQVTSANPMRYWNWFTDQDPNTGEPAIIASLINELIRTEGADPARVYVAGFSAGAAMAAVLASTHPDTITAVGIHSGLPAGAAHDMVSAFIAMSTPGPVRQLNHPVPAITFHGDADPTVNIANSRSLGDQFGAGTTTEIETGSVTGGRAYTVNRQHHNNTVTLEQWVVHGLGHAWSGGRAGGSYTDPTGPDATGEMVRFFLTHQH